MGYRGMWCPDLEAKILCNQTCALLTDKQSRRVGVCTQIIRADTQIDTLQIFGAEDVETAVNNTAFFPWFHSASAKTVPGSFDMVCNPVINGLIVFLAILDVLVNFFGVINFTRFMPRSHVNSDSESVGKRILGRLDVDILTSSRGCRVEAWMMGSELSTEGIHSPCDLSSLLVTPSDRSEICLVVHETTV